MALTLPTVTRNAIADALDTLINSGGGAGFLEFQTSGDVEVATITFDATAFGAASSGTITMASAPKSDTNATGGTMAKFVIRDNGSPSVLILTGSVGTSGQDINFAGGLLVGASDTVELTSFTITCPAS
jgi:hypothetical protein